jgi:Icc-related predicted phosphoesterase
MRLLIYSDLHNEFEPFVPDLHFCSLADVIVLAGDIDLNHQGVDWAKALSASLGDKPTIMVAGNHEFYGGHFDQTLAEMREAAKGSNVHVLENDTLIIEDVRFLGCSLWTDFKLYGDGTPMLKAVEDARQGITDFRRIAFSRGNEIERRLQPLDTVERHQQSRTWLESQLALSFAGPTVVVTHHAPSEQSIAPIYQGDALSPVFASNLEDLMGPHVALWVHGHVHDSFDYEVNGTRVICNPRGYVPDEPNPAFAQAMFVDV